MRAGANSAQCDLRGNVGIAAASTSLPFRRDSVLSGSGVWRYGRAAPSEYRYKEPLRQAGGLPSVPPVTTHVRFFFPLSGDWNVHVWRRAAGLGSFRTFHFFLDKQIDAEGREDGEGHPQNSAERRPFPQRCVFPEEEDVEHEPEHCGNGKDDEQDEQIKDAFDDRLELWKFHLGLVGH